MRLGIGSRVRHAAYGDGVITKLNPSGYEVCYILYGVKQADEDTSWEIIEAIPTNRGVSFSELELAMLNIFNHWGLSQEEVPLNDKWINGKLVFEPGRADMKGYELTIDAFFHKIVMVRDRLRVMEQRINASNLNDEEKVNLQQYITKIYGSLTSFNILFKLKEQNFVGEKSS